MKIKPTLVGLSGAMLSLVLKKKNKKQNAPIPTMKIRQNFETNFIFLLNHILSSFCDVNVI